MSLFEKKNNAEFLELFEYGMISNIQSLRDMAKDTKQIPYGQKAIDWFFDSLINQFKNYVIEIKRRLKDE